MVLKIFCASILSLFIGLLCLSAVPEGYVGVIYRGSVLQNHTLHPGFHLTIPILDRIEHVQITLQSDLVQNVRVGTMGGLSLKFDRIETLNQLSIDHVIPIIRNYGIEYDQTLIYRFVESELNAIASTKSLEALTITEFSELDDRLAAALQANCDRFAPGLKIHAVRVSKPEIPAKVKANYEQAELERTRLLIAVEAQKVKQKEAETERMLASMQAETQTEVAKLENARVLLERKAAQQVAALEDAMHIARQKARAEARAYALETEASANRARLTPAFLEYARIVALANTTKMYFGQQIPKVLRADPLVYTPAGSTATPEAAPAIDSANDDTWQLEVDPQGQV